jgi:hypothetical protein
MRLHNDDQMLVIAGFHGLTYLAQLLRADSEDGKCPDLLHLVVACCARAHGSQSRALTSLNRPGMWNAVVTEYSRATGATGPFPPQPPTAAQQDRFVGRVTADAALMAALCERFGDLSIDLAEALGQFPASGEPDFTRPDLRHTVYGDGTWISPFSAVMEWVDEEGEIHHSGSRAKSRPRVQRSETDPSYDEKPMLRGVNHVTAATWSRSGWVVLAIGQALGAEIDVALNQVDDIATRLQGRLHHVVWDRALTGWTLGWAMSRHGVLVTNKNTARGADKPQITPLALSDPEAITVFEHNGGLPLGTSVYKTTKGHDVVKSRYVRFGQPSETHCPHDLWVDDGALVDVVVDNHGTHRKVTYATALGSRRVSRPHGYVLKTTWSLPCLATPNGHWIDTEWQPFDHQHHRALKGRDRAIDLLRPFPRLDAERFKNHHGIRNASESWNQWFKSTLVRGDQGRAGRLTVEGQALDHLCAALLSNSITAYRSRVQRLAA